jgi:hypothetical protein
VPLPVRSSSGSFAVEPNGAGALLIWDAEIEVLDPAREAEVIQMLDGYYKQTLASLRALIGS